MGGGAERTSSKEGGRDFEREEQGFRVGLLLTAGIARYKEKW